MSLTVKITSKITEVAICGSLLSLTASFVLLLLQLSCANLEIYFTDKDELLPGYLEQCHN